MIAWLEKVIQSYDESFLDQQQNYADLVLRNKQL